MFQALLDSTQTVIFLSITLASFIFVLGGFLLGHGDVHDHDLGGGAHDMSGNSIFSPRILAIFGIAFGAGGSVASIYGLNVVFSSLIGLALGTVLAIIAFGALRLLHIQQVNSLVTDASLIGAFGQVVTRIPADGWGEVTILAQGQSLTQLAISARQIELKKGTRIQIVSVKGNALEVEAVS